MKKAEKKYYLKHKWLGGKFEKYLNFKSLGEPDSYVLDCKKCGGFFKHSFTQAELDEIKKKFNTNLEEFEIEEMKIIKAYSYRLKSKGLHSGTFPKEGFVKVGFDGMQRFGICNYILYYDRRLSDDELKKWKLHYLGDCEVEDDR